MSHKWLSLTALLSCAFFLCLLETGLHPACHLGGGGGPTPLCERRLELSARPIVGVKGFLSLALGEPIQLVELLLLGAALTFI